MQGDKSTGAIARVTHSRKPFVPRFALLAVGAAANRREILLCGRDADALTAVRRALLILPFAAGAMRPDHRVISLALRARVCGGDLVVTAKPASGGSARLDRVVEGRRVVALKLPGHG